MFFLRPLPLCTRSLSALKPLFRTVAPIRALACTAPRASQGPPLKWYAFLPFFLCYPVHCPSLNCGLSGHFASRCPRPMRCHRCHGEGHIASECPKPNPNLVRRCFNCGEAGHFTATCTAPVKCRTCGGEDHLERACPNPKPERAQRWCVPFLTVLLISPFLHPAPAFAPDYASMCDSTRLPSRNLPGHRAALCPSPPRCRACGGEGHLVWECTERRTGQVWQPPRPPRRRLSLAPALPLVRRRGAYGEGVPRARVAGGGGGCGKEGRIKEVGERNEALRAQIEALSAVLSRTS
ncbi:hypothetical protein C8R44DRAFT_744089 [Mycena epipterygia]|nr:hypothetical protein C8R44DRAFT_744089 [Mycena epipterygia]